MGSRARRNGTSNKQLRRAKKRPLRRENHHHPSEAMRDEQEIRHRLGQYLQQRSGEGVGAGVLGLAAEWYASRIVQALGLDAATHEMALTHFLIGQWGTQVLNFDLVGYQQWRELGLEAVSLEIEARSAPTRARQVLMYLARAETELSL